MSIMDLSLCCVDLFCIFFFKQKTAYEMRISDWSSDVCSSDLSADVAIGRMSQNDTFLALTLDPVIAASITEPLPRNSLEGEINTTVINLRLSSRPTRQFHWGASFRRSEEHTSELQSLMRISYAVFCLKKKKTAYRHNKHKQQYRTKHRMQ